MRRSMPTWAPGGLAVLALAGAASGQTWTWMAEVSDDVIEPGESVTVTMSAFMAFETPFVALAAFQKDILIQEGAELGSLDGYSYLNDLGKLIITLDDDNFYDVTGGQLTVFGPFTSDNPIDVFEFTWTAEVPGRVEYATGTTFATIWGGDDRESATAYDAQVVNEAVFGWTVVPAPGALGLLALGFAVRRRR